MKRINDFNVKLYYRVLNTFLPKKVFAIPSAMQDKRSLFIYFDYEREFGGHKTEVSDEHIDELLNLLEKHNLKTTWFTVGRIFQHYPSSIQQILAGGHEIGSHTYNHISPYSLSQSKLKKDFEQMELSFTSQIKGFHSPNGKWSLTLLRLLKRYKYEYDVITSKREFTFKPFKYVLPGLNKTIRLYSLGDDWGVFQNGKNKDYVFYYFRNMYDKIPEGGLAGIGFHPWVLYSEQSIFDGFELFLSFLKEQKDVQIKPAYEFIKDIRN